MAVGQKKAPLNIPNISELIGDAPPAVTPSAVATMSNALRTGFLTADDIIERTSGSIAAKRKADIQLGREAISPKAIAARQQQLAAQDIQARLAAAQGQAQLPLVQPTAELAGATLEENIAIQKYGPGVQYFKTIGPEAGIQIAPLTPEGTPDYAARAKLGLELFDWKQKRDVARERLIPTHWAESADKSTLIKFNKLGEPITQELEQNLSRQVLSPFSQLQPGKISVPAAPAISQPQDEPPAPMIETDRAAEAGRLRAQLINIGQLEAGAGLSDEEILQRAPTIAATTKPVISVTPTPPAPVLPSAITPITTATRPEIAPAGARVPLGISLGPPLEKPKAETHYTETQQKALMALTRSLATQDTLLNKQEKAAGFDPASVLSQIRMKAYETGTLGQIAATAGKMTDAERKYATASQAWLQGLLRAESGAAIAVKEQDWYKSTFFPVAGDTPVIQAQKSALRQSIEDTLEQVVSGKMNPEEYQTFRESISATNVAQPTATAPAIAPQAAGNIITTPSGQRLQRTSVPGYFIAQ